ncbi:cysteine-rich receptor-like protein kinase 8 [Tanacetum coccineum]
MAPSSSSSPTDSVNVINSSVFQNPLFLHPSDGPGSLCVQDKLSLDDAALQEQLDTCNNMVISWLMSSVSESIAKSIMFVGTAQAIWNQLQTRFALSNGSHKYKLNRQCYDIIQLGRPVSKYYTNMKCVWEELDSMNELPTIVSVTTEVNVFLKALQT